MSTKSYTVFFFFLWRFSKTVFHRIYNASTTMAKVVTYIFVISLDITIHFWNTAIKIRIRYSLHILRPISNYKRPCHLFKIMLPQGTCIRVCKLNASRRRKHGFKDNHNYVIYQEKVNIFFKNCETW